MSIKAQGTQLYFIDPDTEEVVEVECITELTGLSQSRTQIDVSCMRDNEAQYEAGRAEPGQANFGIFPDPREASHLRLKELANEGTTLEWAAGWSDGVDIAPSGVESGGTFDLPATRTWLTFRGYISDFPFEFAQNAVVTSNLGIQTSGPTIWIAKA